jgi:hypothetical protein
MRDRSFPRATATVAVFLALAFALAACSSPRTPRQAANQKDSPDGRRAQADFHKMFEETVPSIEAVLPMATVVDTVVQEAAVELTSRAWFTRRRLLSIKMWMTQAGDTSQTDFFYYQNERVRAWSTAVRRPTGEVGPDHILMRALIAPEGKVLWLEGGSAEHTFSTYLPPMNDMIREANRKQDVMRQILSRRAARLERPR